MSTAEAKRRQRAAPTSVDNFKAAQQDQIRRGQATNLAVQAAIAEGKSKDMDVIQKYFVFYYNLAEYLQVADLATIKDNIKQ